MSADLVARLRDQADVLNDVVGKPTAISRLLREAADELERLRLAVQDERDKRAHGLRDAGDVISGWRITFKQ